MRLLTLCCVALFFAALSACTHLIIENPVLSEMPQARDDAALVYFFKRGSYYNYAKNHYVFDNGEFLGAVKDGSFFFANLAPGVHDFRCLKMRLRAGQTYYLVVGDGYEYEVGKNLDSASDREYTVGTCSSVFFPMSPEIAQPTIANLTYTIVRRE